MRLIHPSIESTGRAISFSMDGVTVNAMAGETIAAALARADIVALRQTRDGGRRGLYCGMGACFECVLEVDGRGAQRSCLVKVVEGMQVRSVLPERSALKALTPAPTEKGPRVSRPQLLVIGAGPGGLSAALAAARRGLKVVVLDERPHSGGQYYKPLAPSHGFVRSPQAQFAQGLALVSAVRAAGVEIKQGADVWGAFSVAEVAVIIDGQAWVFEPERLVLAPGAYERPVPFPGWTLPGVMTTGAAQTLARAYRVSAGRRVLISGNGPLNLQLAGELLSGGAQVCEVLESASRPGPRQWRNLLGMLGTGTDLLREGGAYLAQLRRAKVPLHWAHTVVAAHGTDRLEAVTVARIDAQGRTVPGSERRIECDVLCLGHGFIPSTELARMLGCEQYLRTAPFSTPAIRTGLDGATSLPGVFVVGDGADLGGSRVALARGTLAGLAVARQLGQGEDPTHRRRATAQLERALTFQAALWAVYQAPPASLAEAPDRTMICRCEDIELGTLRQAIAHGHDTLASLKRNTRLGMGRCQGRYCAGVAADLVAQTCGHVPKVDSGFAPRPPAKPVPIAALAFEKPEWGGHLPAMTPNLARPVDTHPLPQQQTDVLVIGAGVLGNCLGYYLARAGAAVLVVDRDDANLQASGANAGSLHVQLLSFDFGAKAQAGGGPAAQTLPLGPLAVGLWQALEQASGESLDIKITGGLMVAENDQGMRFLEEKVRLERSYGIDARMLDGTELRKLSPHLADNLKGAELCPLEGKINPLRATYAVGELARGLGARFQRGTDVQAIEALANGGFRVTTSRGVIIAKRLVNASGAWSSTVGQMLGVAIPVKGAPLQMIVTERAPPLVDHLIAHADRHLSLKQTVNGGVLIGGGWSAGFSAPMRLNHAQRSSIEGNLWVAARVLPALRGLHMLRTWAGMNVNIDGAPILGEVPGVPGFFNAVTSNGYTLAPIVARTVAELITDGHTELDVSAYRIERFGALSR